MVGIALAVMEREAPAYPLAFVTVIVRIPAGTAASMVIGTVICVAAAVAVPRVMPVPLTVTTALARLVPMMVRFWFDPATMPVGLRLVIVGARGLLIPRLHFWDGWKWHSTLVHWPVLLPG